MNRIFREKIASRDKNHVMGIDEFVKLEGIEQGREETSRLFVQNLLRETEFSDEKIASLSNVTIEFVEEVKKTRMV